MFEGVESELHKVPNEELYDLLADKIENFFTKTDNKDSSNFKFYAEQLMDYPIYPVGEFPSFENANDAIISLRLSDIVKTPHQWSLVEKMIYEGDKHSIEELLLSPNPTSLATVASNEIFQEIKAALDTFANYIQKATGDERLSLQECGHLIFLYKQQIADNLVKEQFQSIKLLFSQLENDKLPQKIFESASHMSWELLAAYGLAIYDRDQNNYKLKYDYIVPENMKVFYFTARGLTDIKHLAHQKEVTNLVRETGFFRDKGRSKSLIDQACAISNLNNKIRGHRDKAIELLNDALDVVKTERDMEKQSLILPSNVCTVAEVDLEETVMMDNSPVTGSLTVLPPGFNAGSSTVTLSLTDLAEHKVPQPSASAVQIADAIAKGAFSEYSYLMEGEVTMENLVKLVAQSTGLEPEMDNLGPVVIDFLERFGKESEKQFLTATHIEKMTMGFADYLKDKFLKAPQVFFCNMVKDVTARMNGDKDWWTDTQEQFIKAELTDLMRNMSGMADLIYRFYHGAKAGYQEYNNQ